MKPDVSLAVLQDGVHREVWSSDTAFQWQIPENPARHSRWVSRPLLYIVLASPPFLSVFENLHPFAVRNLLSNLIMVISHLGSAGQLDRLCTPLFLTPEAVVAVWLEDSVGILPLYPSLSLSLSLSVSVTISLPPWSRHCCRLKLLGQEKTLLIFTLTPLCCSLQST